MTASRIAIWSPIAAGRAPTLLAAACALLLAGCAGPERDTSPPARKPADVRARVAALLPATVADRAGWAADVQTAFSALELAPTDEHLCAALAVAEQESGYQADPAVPKLGEIAWKAIDERSQAAGIPKLAVHAALRLTSVDGRSYAERIDAARTERELSETFEDFIGRVPFGETLFASKNPVRTGGPMQVSIAFAEGHAKAREYPYPGKASVRHEVFTRRGGLYYGIAHLLDYPAAYGHPRYRFADFNAGRWASRNAAFQNALRVLGTADLALDGDLLPPGPPDEARLGSTERAARAFGLRSGFTADEVRRDLEAGDDAGFARTRLWMRVFEAAERAQGKPLARALVPTIRLTGPKISRPLTTEWFAQRVEERWNRCMARARS